jgi:arylsulfatase A-like enzyme
MADFDAWAGGTGQTSYVTAQNKYLAPYADRYPHSSRAYGAFGQDFIRESVAAKQAFCLTLFFKAPHRPTTPDPMFDDVYKDTAFRKPPNYGREAGEHLAPQSRLGRQYPRFVEWGYHTDESFQEAMRIYHQQIFGVDYAMGMVMEELERQGVSNNTVIVFSADNGFFNGSHGLGSKELLYEESARVPLIVYDPRHATAGRGRRIGALSGNVDIPATILDLAGLPLPAAMDGVSLAPLVQGTAPRVRDTLTLVQAWGTVGTLKLGVVTETHKYLFWCYGEGMDPAEELFDLANDPYEMRNLARQPEHARVLEQMRVRYDAALAHWQSEAVPYNDYQVFGTLYDRGIPWADKRDLVPKAFLSATPDE